MQISFDPTQRTTPSLSTLEVSRTSQGIANTPTSIESQIRANETTGGFCDWIRSFIDYIRNLLCFSSSPDAGVSTQSLLEQRATIAKDIIDAHFQHENIIAANGPTSVIVTVIKYNDQCDVSYGTASQQRSNRETINTKMRHLLDRASHAENDGGELQIDTLLFKRNPSEFFHVDTWKKFTEDNRGGRGNGTGPLTQDVITNALDTRITSSEKRDEVYRFLASLRRA